MLSTNSPSPQAAFVSSSHSSSSSSAVNNIPSPIVVGSEDELVNRFGGNDDANDDPKNATVKPTGITDDDIKKTDNCFPMGFQV